MITGLESWRAALDNRRISAETIAHVRALPGFQDAIRSSVSNALALYDSDRALHRNAKDIGRLVLGIIALYLDATGGLTHRRLRAISGTTGIASTGRATAILWQLRRIGYVVAGGERVNGRSLRYVPTDEMTSAFRARFRIEVEAFCRIEPNAKEALSRFDEPAFFRAYVAEFGKLAIDAVLTPQAALNPLGSFSERSAGMLILYALLKEADRGREFPPVGPVTFSAPELARRFEVSRTHVRRLLGELERAGYYKNTGDGSGQLEQALADALQSFLAFGYVGAAGCLHTALLAVRDTIETGPQPNPPPGSEAELEARARATVSRSGRTFPS